MVIKSELRAEMARRRAEASAANPLTGLTLSAWAPAQMFRSGIVVSAYWPYRSEIDPRPLMQRFANAGARLALPVTPAKGSDDPLRFHIWSAGDALHPRAFGVHEPHPSAEMVEPDILLVPLLAFDRRGGRLGYGAGHYDRTLERLRALKPIQAIGLAFAAQEIEGVPMEAHDQRLDAVLTERAFIEV
jgi:5-formyltetrahydrofolate cyclo-ligase